ncbi:invasion associated locus B family protein [Cognatishimia activa]|uniref:invasion associated locus B family protein n=1 Tax=Cognatishimia activa TaxID=1715691 RepID=UPI0022304A4A|nr:invasion associated locus B family protein [Cognatishimia activa]UZD92105.1 invasion associated locus B family protein [Cognatishimia activa]
MLDTLKTFALAAAIAVPTATFAQDEAPATQAEAPAPATDLATGQPVVPEVKSETFGDWKVNCQELDGQERCEMTQLLLNDDGSPAIEVSLFRVSNQSQVFAGGTIVAPLGTLLTSQLTISIDGALGKRYPFAFCLPDGCVARVGLTEEDVNGYKKGGKAAVALASVRAPDQVFNFDMSLTGFTAAFDRLPQ